MVRTGRGVGCSAGERRPTRRREVSHSDEETRWRISHGCWDLSRSETAERLVFTWAWEKDGSEPDFGEVEPSEMLVTLEFRARGKQTELVLTQEKFASVESRDRHEQGWTGCFDKLEKSFIE